MKTAPSREHDLRKSRRPVRSEDLRLYRAITGKAAEVDDTATPIPIVVLPAAVAGSHTIGAIARRVLTPDVSHLSLRLREICELGIAQGLKRPQMAMWLRHVSGEAFRRLDEAQARLSESRRDSQRRHIDAPQVSARIAGEKWQNVA